MRPAFSSVAAYLQTEIPVFVPCFNNPTYTAGMLAQLRARGFRDIILVDGGSTFPPMQTLLADPGANVTVVHRPDNPGPRHLFLDPGSLALMPRFFCITDPDLAFNPDMPDDFLGDLAALATRDRMGKVGLALDISAPATMRDDPVIVAGRAWKVWEWEAQFWDHERAPLRPGGDPVYWAGIDTTFALYDRNFFDPASYVVALRVGGRFTCRHLPWHRDSEIPADEDAFYRGTERFSYYSTSRDTEPVDPPANPVAPETPTIAALRSEIETLRRSTSWRITAPLRAIGQQRKK